MNSRFFWSEEHIPQTQTAGKAMSLTEAAPLVAPAQAMLFGFTE
jgi:hypothetical protein